MTGFVLDASASVDLLLKTPAGIVLDAQLPSRVVWWVPEHFFSEVSNVLRRSEARGYITAARAAVAFNQLVASPMHRAQVRPLLGDAWAKRGHLTIPDALYVVLAEHLDATLVTTDERLARSPGLAVATITATHG